MSGMYGRPSIIRNRNAPATVPTKANPANQSAVRVAKLIRKIINAVIRMS